MALCDKAMYERDGDAMDTVDTTVLAPVDYVQAAWSVLTAEERLSLSREALEVVDVLVPSNGPSNVLHGTPNRFVGGL